MQTLGSLRSHFETDGFAVIPHFKSPAEVAALRERAADIIDAFDPGVASGVFSTRAETMKRDGYFLESATTIRCFFEEEAFDEHGVLRVPKHVAVNKIGHAMHDLDPVFDAFSHGPELDAVARDLGNDDPRVYQSMYICKQPHIGGEVRWHQDATYFATQPHTVTTMWFALEGADLDNGCLWVQRGGHRTPLRERFTMRGESGRSDVTDGTPWPTLAEAEPIECEAGTLVVFHGLLPHYSAPNRSAKSRHAYTLHYVDGRVPYAGDNWLQRGPDFPARGFMR
jgi:phytanoyl-CoA hydroxylase